MRLAVVRQAESAQIGSTQWSASAHLRRLRPRSATSAYVDSGRLLQIPRACFFRIEGGYPLA